jgi:hypothetical protein
MLDSALWTQHPATPLTSVGLVYGWNSACYLGQTKPVSDATAAIASQLAILYKLDSSHGWGHYMPARPGDSTIAQLERYAAVFMLVTAASGATWAFDQ